MNEEAKAVQEVAKASQETLKAAQKVGAFFERVCGDLVTDAVGVISDKLKFWRWERATRLVELIYCILYGSEIEPNRTQK